jgi:hypothetical protein
MPFTLNTTFTQDALTMLNATGTNVVVAKPSIGNSAPNVAWIVFQPLPNNQLVWEEQYGIYASTQSIQNGATLTQLAATPFPAAEGLAYTLLPAGFFGPPQASGGSAGSFTALNQFNNLPPSGPGFMTFGLYQNATVNGSAANGNAVSAAGVLYQSTAVMTPFTNVYIWTQSQVKSNTVVTTVTSVQTEVTFGGETTEIDLSYDPTTGQFVTIGQSSKKQGGLVTAAGKLPAGVSLKHYMPVLS